MHILVDGGMGVDIDWEKMVEATSIVERMLKECVGREIVEFYRGNEELARKERISDIEFLKKQLESTYKMNAQEQKLIEIYINSYTRGLVQGAAFVHRVLRAQLQALRF